MAGSDVANGCVVWGGTKGGGQKWYTEGKGRERNYMLRWVVQMSNWIGWILVGVFYFGGRLYIVNI